MAILQPLLSEYLVEHGSLPLADAGHLFIEQEAAIVKDDDSVVEPPKASILFSKAVLPENELQKLSAFISERLQISQQQANKLLAEDRELQDAFAKSESINWLPLGNFHKESDGNRVFEQVNTFDTYLPAISLQPYKQQEALPVEKIAPAETTSQPIYEPEEVAQKDYWWVGAIILLVISLLLILFRFL